MRAGEMTNQLILLQIWDVSYTSFMLCTLFLQVFYKQHQAEIAKKNKQKLSNTLRLNSELV